MTELKAVQIFIYLVCREFSFFSVNKTEKEKMLESIINNLDEEK